MSLDLDILRSTMGEILLQAVAAQSALKQAQQKLAEVAPPDPPKQPEPAAE